MAIGRISGSVLKSNLTRNGVDLAFETNLLYLDVTNSRVGIGTSEPTTTLQVNGTTTTTALSVSGTLSANTIDTNTISSSDSSVIQINDGIEVDGPSQHNSTVTFNAGFNERVNALTSSSTITVNCATARVHTVTLDTNTEFNITNLPTGGTCTIIITQDVTGSRTATFGTDGSAAVKFPSGSSVLSTGANDIDVVSIFNDGTNFLGNIARNYA